MKSSRKVKPMKKRKQVYSFTADPDLVDNAVATATALDQNFSKFVCNALQEKIDRELEQVESK